MGILLVLRLGNVFKWRTPWVRGTTMQQITELKNGGNKIATTFSFIFFFNWLYIYIYIYIYFERKKKE